MQGKGIRIVSTGRALPKTQISNEQLRQFVDTTDEWIRKRTGIGYRYRCEEETAVSLAVKAAERAIKKAGILKEEIGVVLVATSTSDYVFPSSACLVQQRLGLSEEIIAFDIQAACTGFLFGLITVQGFLQMIRQRYALIIGSEKLSGILDYSDRSTCILFGDGAGAALVEASDGRFVQKCWCRGDVNALSMPGPGHGQAYLQMDGKAVFKFAVTALEQAMTETLNEAQISISDIDFVICHQANERIIRHVQKRYPDFEDKFYINIEQYGNTSAASIPIALDELTEQGKLKPGMKILCIGFGAGLTWSGTLLEV